MKNIWEEIQQQLNQHIEIIEYNIWQFKELYRLRHQLKQLAQKESEAKWTELVLSCEAIKRVPSLFCQQVRRLGWNEQEVDKGIGNKNNRIRIDPKGIEEAFRQHWLEIFKMQPDDNLNERISRITHHTSTNIQKKLKIVGKIP